MRYIETQRSQDLERRSSSEVPKPVKGSALYEVLKQEQRERQGVDKRSPLWEEPAKYEQEFWLDLETLKTGDDVVVPMEGTGDVLLAHEGAGGEERIKIVEEEAIPEEARAIRELSRLEDQFEVMVDSILAVAGEDADFTKQELMRMREAFIVEASLAEEPEKERISRKSCGVTNQKEIS